MVAEEQEQSTAGQIASGYMKVQGYTNMVGVVTTYVIGGILVLVGILLGLLFKSIVAFLIFAGVGALMIFLAWLGAKHSKKMREGKYYQVGKGWTEPQ